MKLGINANENSADPDQLASKKPADQDPHFFPTTCEFIIHVIMEYEIQNCIDFLNLSQDK